MTSQPTYDELTQRVLELEAELSKNKQIESELQYQLLFNCDIYEVHLWKLIYDKSGTIKTWSLVDANPTALKSWDKSLTEIVGKTTDEIFPGSNATEKFMPIVKKIFSTGVPYKWDEYFPKTKQRLYMTSIPFGDYFYSIGINVADENLKKKIDVENKQEIELSKKQIELILSSSGVAIWKYNIQENILEWDDSMYELYEINREDFGADYNAWESSLHPEDAERGYEEIEKAIRGEKDFDTIFRIITPSKKIKFIHAKALVLKDSEDKPHIMLGTNWDVTEENKYQNLLVEAKENAERFALAKSSFMANMSHEIRTPMNGIIGLTSLLSDSELNEEQKDFVCTIQSCGKSLLNIINDILDYSSIETGNLSTHLSSFDVHKMIDNTAKLFSASALKKKVDIKLKIEKDVPQFIISDQYRVEQVLSNLLNNAIKFSNQSSDVELKVKVIKKDSQNVELDFSVKDDGIGLTEVEQKYIFDEFKQADSSTVRNYGGTGLGLSISLKIAKILGGDIKVKSKKDHGSIFSFFLKAEKGAEIKNSFNEEVDQKLAKKHPHEILIVEDNKVNQKVASKLLARCGYICDIADDGEKAVAACQQKNYTLIFMDLQMPNMNGLTASQIILKEHPEIKIVAMTANILEEERARCFEVGMKSFIGKPFVLNDLIKVIKQLET